MAEKRTPAGRYVKLGQYSDAVCAFVPDPLPPMIEYDSEMANLLAEANGALGELRGLARMVPNPDLFVRPLISREAILSSLIEGTVVEPNQLYAYEADQLRIPVAQ